MTNVAKHINDMKRKHEDAVHLQVRVNYSINGGLMPQLHVLFVTGLDSTVMYCHCISFVSHV